MTLVNFFKKAQKDKTVIRFFISTESTAKHSLFIVKEVIEEVRFFISTESTAKHSLFIVKEVIEEDGLLYGLMLQDGNSDYQEFYSWRDIKKFSISKKDN